MQTSFLKGWLEIGMSNPNIFQYQSNSDVIFRTFDDNTANKIIIGNTSSNNTPNCVGAMYISGNNVGVKKLPNINIAFDVYGAMSISSNLYIGTTSNLSITTLTGDLIIANSNTSNMTITNTSNSFKLTYGNVERLKITNGNGLYLNDNIYVTNDVYASSFHMTSDINLKNNIRQSCIADDLTTLRKLKVSDFTYVNDPCTTTHKGLIAQEVESVFPQAVKEYEGIIPVFSDVAEIEKNGSTYYVQSSTKCLSQSFSVGDKIVIGRNASSQDYILSVMHVDKTSGKTTDKTRLTVNATTLIPAGKVYIHGKLGLIKSIDPNQLLALCISSIQELAKLQTSHNI